ncbi:MAG TPA: AsmA family protein [Ancylobacter sp.]
MEAVQRWTPALYVNADWPYRLLMRKFAPILLLPVLLVLGAAAVAPKLASPERLRAEALTVLHGATGRPATIDGDVSFSILPWPSLDIERLSVGDPAIATLDATHVRIVLDLLPLLTGRARADRIELRDAALTVTQQSPGVDALSTLAKEIGTKPLDAAIRIVDGKVLIHRDGVDEVLLPHVDADIAWRAGRDVELDGKVVWRGEPLDIEFGLSGLRALADGAAGKLRFAVSGAPFDLSFDGTAKLAGGAVADGALAISSRQLRSALAWLDVEAPTENGFGPFALRGHALLSPQNAALSEARIELDGNVSEGGFNLRMDGGRAQLQGSLASGTLDLTPYGQLAISDPDSREWSHDPIDLGRLRKVDLDLRLSANEVRAGASLLRRMAASAVLKSGKLSLAIGEAEAWDGIFRASVHVAPAADGVGADARIEMSGDDVALGRALGDIFRTQRIEGPGSFRMSAGGSGDSIAAIVQHLSGAFTLSGQQGALVGIDVPRILTRLEQRPLSGAGDLRGGRTAYDQIDINATINDGVAHFDQIDIASTKLRIAVTGDASIAQRGLDFEGTAQLASTAPAVAFDLPFVVRGSWDRPLVLPDPQALIRRSGAARPLFGSKLEAIGVAP